MPKKRHREKFFLQRIFLSRKKAAPRFELGIKDLQSSALPLGHAALKEKASPQMDRISKRKTYLLVISNGHGEDLIALRVLEALHQLFPDIQAEVMPLVGKGNCFNKAIVAGWLKKIGPTSIMPSGGFSNQSLSALIDDISSGLIYKTLKQWWFLRNQSRRNKSILAIGDLFPLFLAWSSGSNFAFVGTPKSDYAWKSSPGWFFSDFYHQIKGSEWDPWEWWLMKSRNCAFVAMRDKLTARGLKKRGINAFSPGNPMMDNFQKNSVPLFLKTYRRVLLLCGSRNREALNNFTELLKATDLIKHKESIAILVATGKEPRINDLEISLVKLGYKEMSLDNKNFEAGSCFYKGSKFVFLGPNKFHSWAPWAEIGLANAGTATEQLVGLGIPALSLPGKGPQFKEKFAQRQSRLLGGAVISCQSPEILSQRLDFLLRERSFCKHLGNIGKSRMGPAGGGKNIALLINKFLLKSSKNI